MVPEISPFGSDRGPTPGPGGNPTLPLPRPPRATGPRQEYSHGYPGHAANQLPRDQMVTASYHVEHNWNINPATDRDIVSAVSNHSASWDHAQTHVNSSGTFPA